jgi:hypothetical protein
VNGVGIVRYPDAVPGQLVPKSYRPRTGGRRGPGQGRDALLQLGRPTDERLPGSLAGLAVERREDLAATSVADSEALALEAGLRHPEADRVERADAAHRQAEAGGDPARGGDPDPQPGEGARAEADAEQLDTLPAAGGGSAALDLLEQGGRVLRAPLGGGPEQRLDQDLAVAPGAGGGVLGRGVEADDDQRGVAPSP